MIIYLNSRNQIYYFLFFFILNILITEEKYEFFNITINKNEDELGNLYINNSQLFKDINENDDDKCIYWIPSLFNPILFGKSKLSAIDLEEYKDGTFSIKAPIFSNQELSMNLFLYSLFGKYKLILGKEMFTGIVEGCYFGLSYGLGNNNNIFFDNETNLNKMLNEQKIDKKIFSFDKWIITDSLIKTTLYLGDVHDNFIPNNKGITGECKVSQNSPFWGCEFKEISFNNKKTQLIKNEEKNEFYQIYFSSENHNIIFPISFRDKFDDITNKVCKGETSEEISCDNLFNSENFFQLKLIDDNMIITIEIDNKIRYNNKDNEYKTRIKFEDINYFILPLIVFKNFDIQFNAQDNIISFYTTDESILELKKKNDNNPIPKEEEEPSNAGIIILVIFIVILILVLLFGIFWFLKRRRNSESNINKYNKFEDEENFQDMNDKKVF